MITTELQLQLDRLSGLDAEIVAVNTEIEKLEMQAWGTTEPSWSQALNNDGGERLARLYATSRKTEACKRSDKRYHTIEEVQYVERQCLQDDDVSDWTINLLDVCYTAADPGTLSLYRRYELLLGATAEQRARALVRTYPNGPPPTE